MFHESLFDFQFADFIAAVVIIQESVEPTEIRERIKSPIRRSGVIEPAGAPDAPTSEKSSPPSRYASRVDIEQRVDFIDDDVDIIGTDPVETTLIRLPL